VRSVDEFEPRRGVGAADIHDRDVEGAEEATIAHCPGPVLAARKLPRLGADLSFSETQGRPTCVI
jgi:hypothetical protein